MYHIYTAKHEKDGVLVMHFYSFFVPLPLRSLYFSCDLVPASNVTTVVFQYTGEQQSSAYRWPCSTTRIYFVYI